MRKLKSKCDVYNYTDDNSVAVCDRHYCGLHIKLRQTGNEMLKWFDINFVFSTKQEKLPLCLNVILQSQECANLLEINIDSQLNFNQHIS